MPNPGVRVGVKVSSFLSTHQATSFQKHKWLFRCLTNWKLRSSKCKTLNLKSPSSVTLPTCQEHSSVTVQLSIMDTMFPTYHRSRCCKLTQNTPKAMHELQVWLLTLLCLDLSDKIIPCWVHVPLLWNRNIYFTHVHWKCIILPGFDSGLS